MLLDEEIIVKIKWVKKELANDKCMDYSAVSQGIYNQSTKELTFHSSLTNQDISYLILLGLGHTHLITDKIGQQFLIKVSLTSKWELWWMKWIGIVSGGGKQLRDWELQGIRVPNNNRI